MNAALNILQISTSDKGGGAEKIALDIHRGYLARGCQSWLAVGQKHSNDPTILRIPNERYWTFGHKIAQKIAHSPWPLPARLRTYLFFLATMRHSLAMRKGHEDFYFPGSRHLLELLSHAPDIIHCHNLHGAYFDLRVLPWLSSQAPTILTLHDAWLLSGHCAHSFGCERWRNGCGHCPDLTIPPKIQRDATAYNWRRKQKIYDASALYVATPSFWLMQKVKQSMLAPALIEGRVICNGINLSVFHPAEKHIVRASLDIPTEAKVVMFAAKGIRKNPWKDFQMMQTAMRLLSNDLTEQNVLFMAVGEPESVTQFGHLTVKCVPYQSDPATMARYYQCADVYIHASKADTFPTTLLEALACGVPVVATAVGGIPEQVDNGITGFLIPPGDAAAMSKAVRDLFQNNSFRKIMGSQAAQTAKQRFSEERMLSEYLEWHQEIICIDRKGYGQSCQTP